MTDSPIRSGTGAIPDLWFEDLKPGRVFDLGSITIDETEMVEFARRFDPQWYHVDRERAEASTWGGLIASGFFTASLLMRQYAVHVLSRAAADTSPGLENLRWLAAVRAGDVLDVTLTVTDATDSSRGPHLGTVYLSWEMRRGETVVATMAARGWFHRRP